MSFLELGLNAALARKCESLGYTEPTPIQKQSIPVILGGSDLIGCAETGTGKTAAFLLPSIQRLSSAPGSGVRMLVLAPTRELATQIEASYRSLNTNKVLRCVNIIGGASLSRQREGLRREASVVIATPGRLLDHVERGKLLMTGVEILVIDEADRMLDMGFIPDIERICEMI
ncbi:MAG: DEAD/DEAH box helicase, partial [Pyrinomonadaceae bacterium]